MALDDDHYKFLPLPYYHSQSLSLSRMFLYKIISLHTIRDYLSSLQRVGGVQSRTVVRLYNMCTLSPKHTSQLHTGLLTLSNGRVATWDT